MRRKSLQPVSEDENKAYVGAHGQWLEQADSHLRHEHWHMEHWPHGAVESPPDFVSGEGATFLWWHRYFIRTFEDNLGSKGLHNYSPMPYWVSNTSIPPELRAATGGMTESGMQEVLRAVNNPNVATPTWATFQGGTQADLIYGYTSLIQFKTTDELGISLLATEEGKPVTTGSYHGLVHTRSGGWMATHESPKDPIFYPWHSYVDHIWREWQRRAMPPVKWFAYGDTSTPQGTFLKLFVRDAKGELYEGTFTGGNGSWKPLGRSVIGEPALLLRGELSNTNLSGARIHLLVEGSDRYLWECYWNGSAWRWANTGLSADGNPVIITYGNKSSTNLTDLRIKVFIRDRDGHLREGSRTEGSNAAPVWTWDSGTHSEKVIANDPVPVTHGNLGSVNGQDVRINLFVSVKESDGRETLWLRAWDGAKWAWKPLQQSAEDAAQFVADDASVLAYGTLTSTDAKNIRMRVYVKSFAGTLMEVYWDGSAWKWSQVSGKDTQTGAGLWLASVGRPTVATYGDINRTSEASVRRYLFLQSTSGQLMLHQPDGSVWNTGKIIDGEPVVIQHGETSTREASPYKFRMHVFIRALEYERHDPHSEEMDMEMETEMEEGVEDPESYAYYTPHLKLWRLSWDGAQWSLTDTGKEVAGHPTAVIYGNTKDANASNVRMSVYVADTSQKLWEYSWNGSAWSWRSAGPLVAI
ncbi:MAG TPA: tyrosinase family protein [Pyrinomonadaceae bacterium]